MSDRMVYITIAVIALVTIAIRFAPFLLFGNRKTPPIIEKLGQSLPYAVMAMLVVYCLRDVTFTAAAGFLPQLLACVVVAVSFLWKKNTLLSILLGTVCYMLLIQYVFI